MAGAFALCMVMMLGIFLDGFAIVSHADSKGKVTATSAKIRSEASTDSGQIGSAKKDTTITIVGQVKGADGFVWYEVWVNSTTKGFIRSDLVELIDGNTPATVTPAPATAEPEGPVEVIPVNPVSATVTGGTSVRIRSNASTSTNSKVLAKVSNELVLTVIGKANGTDGYLWYQVNFISNGSQITGFIRSNFVTLSGELTELAPETPPPAETQEPIQPTEEPVQPTEAPQPKEYDTIYAEVNGVSGWRLYTPADNMSWSIKDLLEGNVKEVNTQKTIIIILVILLVAAIAAVGYLIFKLKDVMDSAYFNQVESETLRKRSAAASQSGSTRVMHTVGADKQSAKPAGTQGQKPAGAQGQRPAGTQGQKPAGTGTQGQKPAGVQGQRPAGVQGQKPAGAQGQRPAGAQSQRPVGTAQGQSVQGSAPKPQPKEGQQAQGWQSKNFMTEEDDEFEFEFLNVDDKNR